MKPSRSILDRSFPYVSSVATSVAGTWRRFGWRPTTDEERSARHARTAGPGAKGVVARLATRSPMESPGWTILSRSKIATHSGPSW